ncbi:hypothetical protein C0993_003577 [Termitomyces sp. T159_Od127]|nr:hypothetical protein C0993_003577 [Termitomyces sp. T159_Od127]
MSLPPATKDISSHPAPGSVVDPVNRKDKDADVDRKQQLRLYGVIEAFRLGRLPSNKQIDQTLQYVLDHSPVTTEKLSNDGKKLVHDVQEIIKTMKTMVHDKNRDELFQQFLWHTRDVDVERELKPAKEGASSAMQSDAVKQEAESQQGTRSIPDFVLRSLMRIYQAVRHLRTLLSLVLTNSEVRKLFSDFSLIGRDLLSTTLQKASSHIGPSREELAHVNEPAPEGQFITEGGRPVGTDETPVMEARVPGTDTRIKEGGGGARVRRDDGEERDIGQMRESLHDEKERAKEGAKSTVGLGSNQQQPGDSTTNSKHPMSAGIDTTDSDGIEKNAGGTMGDERVDRAREIGGSAQAEATDTKKGFMERVRGVRETFSDRVPPEHRDRMERGKKFLSEDYFPPERREQFIYRGKKVIIECQKHDDYQEAIRWLLDYVGAYATQGRKKAKEHRKDAQAVGEVSSFTSISNKRRGFDKSLKRSIREIRTLLERFANNQTMEPIIDAFNVLRDDAQRDKELRDWFNEVDRYLHQVLLEPGYVLDQACNDRANQLRESGRRFYDDKYKGHFDRLFGSIGNWFKAMGEDPLNKQFGEDWARLTHDLLFDSEGSLKFKKDLWNDIRHVILPQIIDKVGYIPIPRIEYTDESLDLVVENLTLSGRNLFPNIIALEAHNFLRFSPYASIADESRHRFTLTFGQMQADMRDVAFYYRKKTGMAKMRDSGLADVLVPGEGMTATVVLVSAGKDRSSVFKVNSVHVKVDSLKFSIRDSKHDLLYKTLKPLATGLIKRQIQKAMQDAITTGLEYVDGQLVAVRDRMESAKTKEEGRGQALKDLFKSKKDERPSSMTASTTGSQSQFKVVADKRQSLLVHEGHPAGWVNRTQEKSHLATVGDDWRSDA